MDAKLRQISKLLKRYDSDLFPKRFLDGSMGIMRKRKSYSRYRLQTGSTLWFINYWDDLVIPVTDNWLESGRPVDQGIEPIYWQLLKTDSWRDDGDYDRFCNQRERKKQDRERHWRNEVRALAADCRQDFARATNDINTSTLEKVDRRRD